MTDSELATRRVIGVALAAVVAVPVVALLHAVDSHLGGTAAAFGVR